jgi:hypothetical protein
VERRRVMGGRRGLRERGSDGEKGLDLAAMGMWNI